MAAVSAERDSAKMFRASESCSVCLDAVSDSGERSIAKLKCGHHFHLDCIGSAFNAKGAMQCPNCRHVENGQWLYANGARWTDDFPFEEISYEDDYEVYQTTLSPFLTHRAEGLGLNHIEFCPYGHLGLTSGGSSNEPFPVAWLRDLELPGGRNRLGPEVVVNVSYNYNDSGGASSSPPVRAYPDAQARQSQATEESRVRQPVPQAGSTRPLDPSGASNSGSSVGSLGSLLADGGDVLNFGRGIWGPNRDRYSQSAFSGYSRTDTSNFTDQTRFSPTMDRFSPTTDFLSRERRFNSDTGSGSAAHERSNSWYLAEQRMTNPVLGLGAQHSHNESFLEEPIRHFGPVPVGNNQSQQLRSAHLGGTRRTRQNGVAAPSTSGGGRAEPYVLGSIAESSSRRAGQSCPDLSLSLGTEPPVPGLESHGSGYHRGGQGFVPWGRRDNNPSGPSSSPWSPGQLWHPPTRTSPGLPSSRFSNADFIEGHGSSLPGSSQHGLSLSQSDLMEQISLYSTFGTEPAGGGGPIRNRMPSPTPYNTSLRPPSPPVRWCT